MKKKLKKIIYSGVGFVSLTAERMKTTVEGLIKDGKLSEEEGEKILGDFTKNTESKRDELESQFKGIVEKVLKSLNLASTKDVENIENRIAVLETLLVKMDEHDEKKEDKKPAAPKKSAKKDDKDDKDDKK